MPGMIATTRSDEQKKKDEQHEQHQPRRHHDESLKGDVLVRTSSYYCIIES